MKKLLIDAGNSGMKWSLFDSSSDNDQLSEMQSYPYGNILPIDIFTTVLKKSLKESKIDTIVMVSVLGDQYIESARAISLQDVSNFINVESQSFLADVKNAYTEPYKLGADRFVAMIAAYHFSKKSPKVASIVVDSGTATTIDAIDQNGQHLGGVILSGLDLCSQSLLENTELLPLFNKNRNNYEPTVFSCDTKQAITSGSIFGLAGAIDSICSKMTKEIEKGSQNIPIINKIITGGATEKLLPYLSSDFQRHENLLMHGLKVISEIEISKS